MSERSKNLLRGKLGSVHCRQVHAATGLRHFDAGHGSLQSGCLFLSDMFRGQESIADCQFISDLSSPRHRSALCKSEEVPVVRAVQDSLLLSTRACLSLLQRQAARNVGKSTTCLPAATAPLFVARSRVRYGVTDPVTRRRP